MFGSVWWLCVCICVCNFGVWEWMWLGGATHHAHPSTPSTNRLVVARTLAIVRENSSRVIMGTRQLFGYRLSTGVMAPKPVLCCAFVVFGGVVGCEVNMRVRVSDRIRGARGQ